MSAFRPIADIGAQQTSSLAIPMINTGNTDLGRQYLEHWAALGDAECLCALGHMHHFGEGVPEDRVMAMKLYRRAWRRGSPFAAFGIAILYREQEKFGFMFRWFERGAMAGDDSGSFEMAKCYLNGVGVRKDPLAALRCLVLAIRAEYITEEEREEAQALLDTLRPREV